jgi:phenylpyruvate tautomerase PptA (4-oxalocrotonate tautomerase family)
MPFVQVQHPAGAFTGKRQTDLIQDTTEAFVGSPARDAASCSRHGE